MVYCMFSPDVKEVQALWDAGEIEKAEYVAQTTFCGIKKACDRIDPETGCWIWREGVKYPQLTHGARVHRVVAAIRYGELGTQQVHHTCANPCCVNPEHLQVVTREQNVGEMRARVDYEKFIVVLLKKIKGYNPDDPVLKGAMPGNVSERLGRDGRDITPAEMKP